MRERALTWWAAAPFALFLILLVLARPPWEPLQAVDMAAVSGLHTVAVAHPGFAQVMQITSALGSALAWQVVTVVVALVLLLRRRWADAVFVVVIVSASSLLNSVTKAVVGRARPTVPDPIEIAADPSFPSGHSQAAVVGYGVLLVLVLPHLSGALQRCAVVLAAMMVVAIGFSRVALGVHYPSDVVGGFALGLAWLAIWTAVWDRGRRLTGPSPATG